VEKAYCVMMVSQCMERVKSGKKRSAKNWPKGQFFFADSLNCGAVAVAVQRGNALAMLTGYTRATAAAQAGQDRWSGGQSAGGAEGSDH
jgi:hypothetical protein